MMGAHPRTSCRKLFKKLEFLTVPSQYIYSLMSFFFIGNQDKFLTNSSVHGTNTRHKRHLIRPIANMSFFQKGASYSGIRIFNNLPQSITSFRNEMPQFKLALKNFYMHTPLTLWMNFLHVQMICITDLYDCNFSHCNNVICFVCF